MIAQIQLKYFPNWGGRIRTYEWRSQSPQPYHLATPQQNNIGIYSSVNIRFVLLQNKTKILGKKGFEPLTP